MFQICQRWKVIKLVAAIFENGGIHDNGTAAHNYQNKYNNESVTQTQVRAERAPVWQERAGQNAEWYGYDSAKEIDRILHRYIASL